MGALDRIAWRPLLYYLVTGLILVVPALYNKVPLVYSDTGTYLDSARSLLPPTDRTIGYGFIIRAVNWQSTLWTIVIFQGLVSSWLTHRTMQSLFPAMGRNWRPHVVVLALLLCLSSLPWYVSWIMPDVFTGLLALCVFLLLFGRRVSITERVLLILCTFFFSLAHLAHPLMLIGLALVLLTLLRRLPPLAFPTKTLVCIAAVPVAAMLFIMGYNARHGQGFVLSRTSDLFLAARLIESGAMYLHLERTCDQDPVYLCLHRNELVNNAAHFVWVEHAALRQGQDMIAANDRVEPIVRSLLTDVRNWPYLVWSSVLGTLQQLVHVDIGAGVVAYREQAAPWWIMAEQYQHELPFYMVSLQQRGGWLFDTINRWNYLVLILSVLVIVVSWPSHHHVRWWAFLWIVVATVVLNALCTGALANVYERLQARVTWLLVLSALLLLYRWGTRMCTLKDVRRAFA